jgi:tetratricopeptide (TPR) repeat protein
MTGEQGGSIGIVWRAVVYACCAVMASLAMLPLSLADGAPVPAAVSCPPGSRSPVLDAARVALDKDEAALEPRLKLADALLAAGCYGDAVHVLEEGETTHPRNGGIQSRLRDARSMLSEQRYFDGLGRAEEAAKDQRNLLRCRKLNDISACDEALRLKPDDTDVLSAKADALAQSNRPADALLVYRRAAELNPSDASLSGKIAAAEGQREALATECQRGTADAALQACQLALLRGANDEFTVHQRTAILLQGMDKPSRALDSYIAASLLRPQDKSVALAIVTLSESTARKDALTLAARGSALLTLNRGTEAAKALREAQALSPNLPDVKTRLAAAQKMAQAEARRNAAASAEEKALAAAASSANGNTPERVDTRVASEEKRTYSNEGPPTRSH